MALAMECLRKSRLWNSELDKYRVNVVGSRLHWRICREYTRSFLPKRTSSCSVATVRAMFVRGSRIGRSSCAIAADYPGLKIRCE